MSEFEKPDISEKENPDETLDAVLGRLEGALASDETIEAFLTDRLSKLESTTSPTELSVVSNKLYNQFIHPETKVVRNYMVDPFKVNDPALYQELITNLRLFKSTPGWAERSLRNISLPALQHTLATYFGNAVASEDTENNNRAFYMRRVSAESNTIDLADFKSQNIAVCAEKAAAAQNLLKILGYESEMVFSSQCRLQEEGPEEAHVYQLLRTDKGNFIYDSANPVTHKAEDGQIVGLVPAIYSINETEIEKIHRGETITVTHNDQQIVNGEQQVVSSQRIYGG